MDQPPQGKAAPAGAKAEKATTAATTLLDVQEVEWITRELERLLAREQTGGGGGGGGGVDDGGAGGHRRPKRAKVSHPAARRRGFLAELLGRHAVSICSGDAAIVDGAATAARSRQRGGRRSFREVEKV
ncbi:hypothetical protein ACP4OV_000975 [Aristida adscensionis]